MSMSIDRLFGKPMLGVSLDKSWVVHHAGRQKLKGLCSSQSPKALNTTKPKPGNPNPNP